MQLFWEAKAKILFCQPVGYSSGQLIRNAEDFDPPRKEIGNGPMMSIATIWSGYPILIDVRGARDLMDGAFREAQTAQVWHKFLTSS